MASSRVKAPVLTEAELPSVRLVEHLAKARECDPIDIEPLYGKLDLEHLDGLVASMDEGASLELSIGEHRFEIGGNGAVHPL